MTDRSLRLSGDPSHSSVFSNSPADATHAGDLPASILPLPGSARHRSLPNVSNVARDLSVMGSSALASVENSGANITSSDVLADPVIAKWFKDNESVSKDVIDIITSVHHRKLQALKDTAIRNMSKLESAAREKLESAEELKNANLLLQQQLQELKAKTPSLSASGSEDSEPQRLARRGEDLFTKQVDALSAYARVNNTLASDLAKMDEMLDEVHLRFPFGTNDKMEEDRILSRRKHKVAVHQRLQLEFRRSVYPCFDSVPKDGVIPKFPLPDLSAQDSTTFLSRKWKRWCVNPIVVAEYGEVIPDILRMLNVFDTSTGIWSIPRMLNQVQVEYRDIFEQKSTNLFYFLLDQCDSEGRADCRARFMQPSMLVGKHRQVFTPERSSGVHALFMIFQCMEADSSSMAFSCAQKLRDLDKLFVVESDIISGVAAANETIQLAARFDERPSWKDCGQYLRNALQNCSNAVRFKFLELHVPSFAVSPNDCSPEISRMFAAATAARNEQVSNADRDRCRNASIGISSPNIPVSAFMADMSYDTGSNFEDRMHTANGSFLALRAKLPAMTDGSVKRAASEIVDYVNPSFSKFEKDGAISQVILQLRSGDTLKIDGSKFVSNQRNRFQKKCFKGDSCTDRNCTFLHPRDSRSSAASDPSLQVARNSQSRSIHPSNLGKRPDREEIQPCKVADCKSMASGIRKSYCDHHYTELCNGAEVTTKDGLKKSFPYASKQKQSGGSLARRNNGRADQRKKARLLSLVTPDGQSMQADMDEDQLRVFQAALVGARFTLPEDDEEVEQQEDDDYMSAIQEIVGYTSS